MGQTIFYDPPTQRMLIARRRTARRLEEGQGRPEFRELYAFDPKTETVKRLADCPTAFYSSHLAYDAKHELFFAVAVFNKGEQPSGMFAYDPKKDAWHEIKPANRDPAAQELVRLDAALLRRAA